ncbi:MAG: FAD-dependent oxidoreductase, partial [Deltaproteobacteria bacterium]|nr:FAD-dependent oxidoreductase [Deltaproteobacteria bacterium]
MIDVAVIGAGPAGAMCARELASAGVRVEVFDKARGAGGRLSTRRRGGDRFDHGAQYFTARDPALAARVADWEQAGVVAPWEGSFGTLSGEGFAPHVPSATRWVGVPGMSAVVKYLLAGVDVHFGRRVTGLRRDGGGWTVLGEDGSLVVAERVVVAVPTPQALPLLAEHRFAALLDTVRYAPCWAVMAPGGSEPAPQWSAARVEGSPLAWVARNQTKPGRSPGEQWVLHAGPKWSAEHLDDQPDAVAAALVA